VPADGAEAFGILTSMEERELHFPAEQALIGWRLFRVRRSESGFVLSAPLIHNPGFERFPYRTIEAMWEVLDGGRRALEQRSSLLQAGISRSAATCCHRLPYRTGLGPRSRRE